MPTGFTLGYEFIESLNARDEVLQEMEEIQNELNEKDGRVHRCERRLIAFLRAKEASVAIRGRVFYLDPNGDLVSQTLINPSDESISEEELDCLEGHDAFEDDDVISIPTGAQLDVAELLTEADSGESGVLIQSDGMARFVPVPAEAAIG